MNVQSGQKILFSPRLFILEFVSSHALQERLHNMCNGAM